MSVIPAQKPLTESEWVRSVEQRLKQFQNRSSVRIGRWVITEVGGNLTAVRPGDEFELGEAVPTTVDLTGALRGFVTQDDLDEAQDETEKSIWEQLWEQLTGETDPGDDVLAQLANFLTGGLFGQIDISRLPSLLPLSRIRDVVQNLFLNGDFKTLTSIAPDIPDWFVDLTDGIGGRGSAWTTADGTSHILFSNNIDVDPDSVQTLNVSSFVRYEDLVSTGDAIKIQVSKYLGNTYVGTEVIDVLTAPMGTLATWVQELSGTWQTPGDGTVDNVTTELVVAPSATSGQVKFSKALSTFSDLLPQQYVSGLLTAISSIWNGIAARIADWQALLDVFNNGPGGILNDVEDRIRRLTSGGLFDAGFLTNIGNIPAGIPGGNVTGIASNLLADFSTNIDNLVQRFLGVANTGNTPADANTALMSLRDTVLGLSRDVQSLQQAQNGSANFGKTYRVDFADYANGPLATVGVPFDLFYSGTGTGYQEIVNGVSQWHKVTDGDRTVIGIYNGGTPGTQGKTDTDYQWLQATAAGAMGFSGGQSASNMFFCRVNAAVNTGVYIKGYRTGAFGLGFKCELGCFVGGVQTVFVTNVNFTFSLNLGIKAGVGGNPYRFQVLSGNTIVIDYTDTAHVSQVGANYRAWGWNGATANGGDAVPGSGTYFQCTDNAPVAVTGSTLRVYRNNTATVTVPTGDVVLPANTFDVVDYKSADISWNPATNEITIGTAGTYMFALRLEYNNVAGMGATNWYSIWWKNNVVRHYGKPVKSVGPNGFGVPATSLDSGIGGDPYIDYLLPGNVIKVGMGSTGSTDIKGDSSGGYTNLVAVKVG